MTSHSSQIGSLSPEPVLLGLLAEQPAYANDLHQRLLTDLGALWHVSQTQVYNILARLEQQGLIQVSIGKQETGRARQIYNLTAAGRQCFEAWLGAPSACSARAIRVEFLTRLYFAQARGPEITQNLIDTQLEELRMGLTRLNTLVAALPSAATCNRLGLQFRIRQLSSLVEWLAEYRCIVGQTEPIPIEFEKIRRTPSPALLLWADSVEIDLA